MTLEDGRPQLQLGYWDIFFPVLLSILISGCNDFFLMDRVRNEEVCRRAEIEIELVSREY